MEFADYLSSILAALLLIVGFFLRKVLNDVESLKKSDMTNQLSRQKIETNEKNIEKIEEIFYKKFTNLHAKNEVQSELNSEFKALLASINTKLDILLKDHQ